MFYTIYQITHKPTGKIYIGLHKTNDLNDSYMGSGVRLKEDQKKYGLDQFKKKTLYIFDNEDEMYNKEKELVTEEFCDRDDTYNSKLGGTGGWSFVNRNGLIDFQKRNERIAKIRDYRDPVYLQNASKSAKLAYSSGRNKVQPNFGGKTKGTTGLKYSEETKQRMSVSGSGRNNSQYGSIWITNGVEAKKIKNDEPLPEGWRRGRK